MSGISWFRAARRAVGLSPLPEYPNLEALLRSEEGQPHNDYRVLARVAPPVIFVLCAAALVPILMSKNWGLLIGDLGYVGLGVAAWFVCDRIDKSIPKSKKRIRFLCEKIWSRYRKLANISGVEPALLPEVAVMLDEASAIFLKQTATKEVKGESHLRALQALSDAMARMLDLGEPASLQGQQLQLSVGWAESMLAEMREMDVALDRHLQGKHALHAENSPLAGLRGARIELQEAEEAIEELRQL